MHIFWQANLFLLLGWLVLGSIAVQADQSQPVRTLYMPKSHSNSGNPFRTFYWDLANIALHPARSQCTNLELQEKQEWVSYERLRLQLKENKKMDIIWGVSSYVRETELQPIKIDLLKGLNGYRAIVVKKSRIEEFQNSNLTALQKYSVGSAYHWIDSKVLAANGFKVVTFSDFNTMYPMLEHGRFGFASRGLDQLWDELSQAAGQAIAPVPNLYFHYELPIYFFVRNDDKKLAGCLRTGLLAAIADGSYQKLYDGVRSFKEGEKLLQQKGNTIIELVNPFSIAPYAN